ncbi:MAG: hypothetical protein AAF938_14695 [Myxococcota bacterium]
MQPVRTAPAPPPPRTCELSGPMDLPLYAPTGFAYGTARGAQATLRFETLNGVPTARASTETLGWRLESVHALGAEVGDVYLDYDTALREGITYKRGLPLQVLALSDARLRVAPAPQALERAHLRFEGAETQVGCNAVSLRQHRSAPVGDGETFLSDGHTTLTFTATPGGRAVADYTPPRPVPGVHAGRVGGLEVLESRGEQVRLRYTNSGLSIEGWVASTAVDRSATLAVMGGLGLRGRTPTLRVCRSASTLDLYASGGGTPEIVGTLMPGARFIAGDERGETLRVEPAPGSRVRAMPGIQLAVRRPDDLSCTEEATPQNFAFTLEVTSFEQQSGDPIALAPGARCRAATTVRRPRFGGSACRTEVTCGDATFVGNRSSNGYFNCEADPSARHVVGEDPYTTEQHGNDPALRFNTEAATVRVWDDEGGHLGAFSLEARIVAE